MITQAVKHLPKPEMWTLQAKCGHVEFGAVVPADLTSDQLADAFGHAIKRVEALTERMRQARVALKATREQHLKSHGRITSTNVQTSMRQQYEAARDEVRDVGGELARAEAARTVQIAIERAKGSGGR